VSTSAGLTSALANTAVAHIVLAPGTYYLSAELRIDRDMILEAAVAITLLAVLEIHPQLLQHKVLTVVPVVRRQQVAAVAGQRQTAAADL
jgi:hypothetical protein